MPVGEPIAYALFAHCFTCSKNYRAVVNISRALARSGLSVLRFDFTGLGESEGEFSETTFSSNIEDLVAAAEFLARGWERPSILIGHSLGGAAVIRAAGRLPSVEAVVTINSPADPEQVKRHLSSSLAQIEESGHAEVTLAGRPFTIKREFLEDVSRQNMTRALEELEAALLVFHSPDDEVVDFENAERIFATARSTKTFITLQGADHLLTRPADSEYVGSVVAAWAARYLGATETVTGRGEARRPTEGEAVVRTGRTHYHTEVLVGRHRLISDEPEEAGGADTGPEPFGLLMSSLGACTTITLRMYADRKEWPLEEVGVRSGSVYSRSLTAARCIWRWRRGSGHPSSWSSENDPSAAAVVGLVHRGLVAEQVTIEPARHASVAVPARRRLIETVILHGVYHQVVVLPHLDEHASEPEGILDLHVVVH
jgi:putative redox protein